MRTIFHRKKSITNLISRSVIIPVLAVYILISIASITMQIFGIRQTAKNAAISKAVPILNMIARNKSMKSLILSDFEDRDDVKMYILDSRKLIISSTEKDPSTLQVNHITMNYKRGTEKHVLHKCDDEIKSISYFPINNTPGWTLVLVSSINGAFHSVHMHTLFLIVSTTLFIIFFYSLSRKVSKRVATAVRQMADRLQSAAEGDFKSEIKHTDDIEEVKYLSNAIHSIVSRMNIALSGSNDFNSRNIINHHLNLEALNPLIRNYKNTMKTNLCIRDTKGEIIVGEPSEENNDDNIYTGNIIVKGKIIAYAELSPLEGCIPPRHELPLIVRQIAFTASHMVENSYNNARQYEIWKRNEEYNIRNLTKSMENFSKNMHQWVTELEVNDFSDKKNFKTELLMFTARTKEILAYIDENSEYSKFMEFSTDMKEEDYSTRDFSLELQKKISDSLSDNDSVDFSISGKIPSTLFGDKNSIIKIIKRILISINAKNSEYPLSLKISSTTSNYSTMLFFEITTNKEAFTENEISRLKLISKKGNGYIEDLTTFEQKITSAFNLAFKIDANIEIETDEEFKIKISIPQLNVKEMEEN